MKFDSLGLNTNLLLYAPSKVPCCSFPLTQNHDKLWLQGHIQPARSYRYISLPRNCISTKMGKNVILYVSNAYHTVNALCKSLIQLVCDLTEEGPDLEVYRKKGTLWKERVSQHLGHAYLRTVCWYMVLPLLNNAMQSWLVCNNFRTTAVLKKNMICKIKLNS